MWQCTQCNESLADTFDACWKCGRGRDGTPVADFRPVPDDPSTPDPGPSPEDVEVSRPIYRSTGRARTNTLRWYQYRLRSLLILVTAASLPLSWLAVKIHQGRRQKAAVAAIQALGGSVKYDSAMSRTPAWLRSSLGDDCFANVVLVDLRKTHATDVDIAFLDDLPKLCFLGLSDTMVTDSGMKHLQGLSGLGFLLLGNTQITDVGLCHIADLQRLDELNLGGTLVTDNGLKKLAGLSQLQVLGLYDTRITDAGLKDISKLSGMLELYMDMTAVTDTGIDNLKELKHLGMLSLKKTRVTEAGVAKLQRALPKCRIEWK
jgi:hypothetical protein